MLAEVFIMSLIFSGKVIRVVSSSSASPQLYNWFARIKAKGDSNKRAGLAVVETDRVQRRLWRSVASRSGKRYGCGGKLDIKKSKPVAQAAPYDWRLAVAGGLAGGITNFLLYPLDTLKTMRQSDTSLNNMGEAFAKLANAPHAQGLRSAYGGVVPAVLGSVPSSAIYFGTYEFAKRFLSNNNPLNITVPRPAVHMLAATSGNVLSSIIFVPKDMVKQQMQARRTGSIAVRLPLTLTATEALSSKGLLAKADMSSVLTVIGDIFRTKGFAGFYQTFAATLARNIPSAVIRFTVYEELRARLVDAQRDHREHYGRDVSAESETCQGTGSTLELSPVEVAGFVIAGSAASAFASALCTPLDVVKTRIATGVLRANAPLHVALSQIYAQEGLHGLFAGVNSRIVGSSLFGGIGFASFEMFKTLLGYQDLKTSGTTAQEQQATRGAARVKQVACMCKGGRDCDANGVAKS